MKTRIATVSHSLSLLLILLSSCSSKSALQQNRETVLDQIISIESEVVTEIPAITRLCDELNIRGRRIRIGNTELYIEEEGRGTPLLLINGGPGGTHHDFHPWFSRASRFSRVIYYDQRGSGLSDYEPGPEGYSVHQAVEDIDELRKALGIERWVVLGHSYGGFLAQYYTINHPDNVAALVLVAASHGMWVKLGRTRQYQYMSREELDHVEQITSSIYDLADEKHLSADSLGALVVYNNILNGDWKRQGYYKPTQEEIARLALYGWRFDRDNDFRGGISESMDMIDLTGAFQNSPIPTLILEGEWDLTWNTDKPGVIQSNHPDAELIMFNESGHTPFADEPIKFYRTLKTFLRSLPTIAESDISSYQDYLVDWEIERKKGPVYMVRTQGDDRDSYRTLVDSYSRSWIPELINSDKYFRYITDFRRGLTVIAI